LPKNKHIAIKQVTLMRIELAMNDLEMKWNNALWVC
jgi:hypothetical protein